MITFNNLPVYHPSGRLANPEDFTPGIFTVKEEADRYVLVSTMSWSHHLTHKLMDQFNGDHFSKDIYYKLLSREPELAYHNIDEVKQAIATWQERRLL